MNNSTSKKICNVEEISNYLNMSQSMIRKLVREKRIPFFRLGNRLKFDLSEINIWISNLIENESKNSIFF